MPLGQYFGYPNYSTPLNSLEIYLNNVVPAFLNFTMNLLAALVVFLFGWLLAVFIKFLIEHLLEKVSFRDILRKVGLDKYFENFVWEERFDKILAEIVFWLIILVFLMTSFDILGLQVVNSFLRQVVDYIPRAIAGGLILAFGFILGELIRKGLLGVLHALERKSAQAIASFIKWTIVVFAFLAALNQWGITSDIINILVMGLVLFIALAGGLAFGLGGQELAREILQNWKRKFE